ncbi:MAG: FecR domain-containing protein [Steroidobacteraceae bacterium]
MARLKRGLRPDEGPQLLSWLARRSHRKLIAKAAVEWHGPEVLAVLSEIFPIDPAILEPRRGTHPAVMAGAAAISLCITMIPVELGLLAHFGLLHQKSSWYTTTPEATRRLTLKDGTRVALNRGTGINIVYLEHVRSVLVARGEAIFKVASEPYRPFDVHAGGRNFETNAATFDIRLAGADRLTITVLDGTVTVFPLPPRRQQGGGYAYTLDAAMYRPILLQPMQMLVIEPEEQSGRTLTPQDVRSRLAWQGGT